MNRVPSSFDSPNAMKPAHYQNPFPPRYTGTPSSQRTSYRMGSPPSSVSPHSASPPPFLGPSPPYVSSHPIATRPRVDEEDEAFVMSTPKTSSFTCSVSPFRETPLSRNGSAKMIGTGSAGSTGSAGVQPGSFGTRGTPQNFNYSGGTYPIFLNSHQLQDCLQDTYWIPITPLTNSPRKIRLTSLCRKFSLPLV